MLYVLTYYILSTCDKNTNLAILGELATSIAHEINQPLAVMQMRASMMMDKNNYTYDFKKKNDFSDYQFTSSWENNYKSWKDNQLIPVMFIKYEDLLKETISVFKEIIEFINKLTNNKYL